MMLRLAPCRSALLSLVLTTALACGSNGGGGGGPPLMTSGMLGEPSASLIAGNLIFVHASMNATDETPGVFGMLIDSGSPVVLIDPTLFSTPPPATVAQIPTKVDLGLLDASGNPVVVIEQAPVLQVSNAMMDGLGFGGVLGGTVMRQFSVQLDYSAPMMEGFCLGCLAGGANANVQSGAVVSFTLKGGGTSAVQLGTDSNNQPIDSPAVNIPATRIPVTVTFDGVDHQCIVDTGATEVSLRSTVYSALTSDGRAQLVGGIQIMTIAGSSSASLTRAKTITVGGATVTDAPVMTIVSGDPAHPDPLLDGISHELGMQLDCLLGGSFLRNFLVTIDYPNGKLHLDPYLTPPIPDEFRRVGITIALDVAGQFVVQSVYPGTDAAKQGIMVGDEVISIDGTSLASVGYVAAADQLLDGTPGTSKTIVFGTLAQSGSHGSPLSVMVDDLLPNP